MPNEAALHAPATTGSRCTLARGLQRIVAPNPSPLTGPGTNTYLLALEDGWAVLDPGPDDSVHAQRVVEAAGGAPIRYVLCTHSHPDHSPGAARLRELCGARVYGRPAPADGYQDVSYRPDETVDDGRRFALAAGAALRALHTPGHASNHVCYLLEPQGWLFTGDHLMSGSTVVILPPDGSMGQYLASLRELAQLPLDCLLPGHGPVMPRAVQEIERVIAHRLQREARAVAALQSAGPRTLDALVPEVYADTPVALHRLARFSLLAHLLKLQDEGHACCADDGRWSWRGA